MACIHSQINKDLVELGRVNAHIASWLFKREHQFDIIRKKALQKGGGAADSLIDCNYPGLQGLLTTECHQLTHQIGPARCAFPDLGQVRCSDWRHAGLYGQVVHRPKYSRQQIIEVMRNAAGQLPNRLHPLSLKQLILQTLLAATVNNTQQAQSPRQRGKRHAHRSSHARRPEFGVRAPGQTIPQRCSQLAKRRLLQRAMDIAVAEQNVPVSIDQYERAPRGCKNIAQQRLVLAERAGKQVRRKAEN
jgi:hypothetical protein